MTKEQNKILEEKILTKLFKSKEYLTGEFDINDLFIERQDEIILGELKTRNNKHTDYPDWILENDKLESLIKKQKETNKDNKKSNIYYINYFNDGVLAIWNLNTVFSKSDVSRGKKLMNKTSTPGFNHYGEKVLKDCWFLTLAQAIFCKPYKV